MAGDDLLLYLLFTTKEQVIIQHLILRLTLYYSDYSTQQIKYKEKEAQKIEDHPVQNLALEKNPLLQERWTINDKITIMI